MEELSSINLIEGDLDNHQTEIDFGSVMKNWMFDLSLTRVYRPKNITDTWFLKKSIGYAVCHLQDNCMQHKIQVFKCTV